MNDISVTSVTDIKSSPGYRSGSVDIGGNFGVKGGIDALMQLVCIKLVNKGGVSMADVGSSTFSKMIQFIVSEIKDEIIDAQGRMATEIPVDDSEMLLDLSVSGVSSDGQAFVDVKTKDQVKSYKIALASME